MVSLQEYMAFMISRETENVQSSQDVEAAFRALTSGEKPFISGQELYAVSTPDYEIIVETKTYIACRNPSGILLCCMFFFNKNDIVFAFIKMAVVSSVSQV